MSAGSQLHVAGPALTVNGVRRQRCIWCGALLEEMDLANVSRALEPGEDPENPEPWEPGAWPVGAQVRFEGTFPRIGVVVDFEDHPDRGDSFKIPEDACMALDAEVA